MAGRERGSGPPAKRTMYRPNNINDTHTNKQHK